MYMYRYGYIGMYVYGMVAVSVVCSCAMLCHGISLFNLLSLISGLSAVVRVSSFASNVC